MTDASKADEKYPKNLGVLALIVPPPVSIGEVRQGAAKLKISV
jgi:hypothetical protein